MIVAELRPRQCRRAEHLNGPPEGTSCPVPGSSYVAPVPWDGGRHRGAAGLCLTHRQASRCQGQDLVTLGVISTVDPRRILSDPRLYTLAQRGFGALRARRLFISRYVRPVAGQRILDIGCGTGDILDNLPPVDYVGFDLSPEYIAAAQLRSGGRGRFYQADVLDADLSQEPPFDIVMATGVIHHLDDARAAELVRISSAALAQDGRLLTWDGAFVPGQSRIARWLLERDRGEYVRDPDAYVALAREGFDDVRAEVVTDFLHVPYTHCVLDARRGLGGNRVATSA